MGDGGRVAAGDDGLARGFLARVDGGGGVSNVRRIGQRYTDNGDVFEWADGCVSIPMRKMTGSERHAWDNALWLSTLPSHREDADRLLDRLCEEANRCESRSIRYEQRGMAAEANATLLLAELYDAAAKGLVR